MVMQVGSLIRAVLVATVLTCAGVVGASCGTVGASTGDIPIVGDDHSASDDDDDDDDDDDNDDDEEDTGDADTRPWIVKGLNGCMSYRVEASESAFRQSEVVEFEVSLTNVCELQVQGSGYWHLTVANALGSIATRPSSAARNFVNFTIEPAKKATLDDFDVALFLNPSGDAQLSNLLTNGAVEVRLAFTGQIIGETSLVDFVSEPMVLNWADGQAPASGF